MSHLVSITLQTENPKEVKEPNTVKKRKRTPKEEREDNLRAYMEGTAAWTVEVGGVSPEMLQETWSTFLTDASRCPTTTPLTLFTPTIQVYRGFGRLGHSYASDKEPVDAPTLPPLKTSLVAIDDLASSKNEAVRILGSKTLSKGTALACRYYKPGSYISGKRLKSAALRQSRKETRLYTKIAKSQIKYDSLVDAIGKRIMDPTKGEFVKCGECGARYPRTNLEKALPASNNLYTCVLCGESLVTKKDKERLAVTADALLALKESYRAEAKDFGWLIRVGG